MRLRGAPGEADRRLHFCPTLSLHRSGLEEEYLGWSPQYPGYMNTGPEERAGTEACKHLYPFSQSLHQSGFLFCSHWPRAICLGLFHAPTFFSPIYAVSTNHRALIPGRRRAPLCGTSGPRVQFLCSWTLVFFLFISSPPESFPCQSSAN